MSNSQIDHRLVRAVIELLEERRLMSVVYDHTINTNAVKLTPAQNLARVGAAPGYANFPDDMRSSDGGYFTSGLGTDDSGFTVGDDGVHYGGVFVKDATSEGTTPLVTMIFPISNAEIAAVTNASGGFANFTLDAARDIGLRAANVPNNDPPTQFQTATDWITVKSQQNSSVDFGDLFKNTPTTAPYAEPTPFDTTKAPNFDTDNDVKDNSVANNVTVTKADFLSMISGNQIKVNFYPSGGAGFTGVGRVKIYSGELSFTQPVTASIDAGGAGAGAFSADGGFSGGHPYSVTSAIDTSQVSNPAPQEVYQTERYGNFTYSIPNLTPNTAYNVRLDFAENYANAAGQRTFNVAINGKQVLSRFDIFATAGGKNKAIAESFAATSDSSGNIVITFTTVKNNAKVDGIEITDQPVSPSPSTAYMLNAGGGSFGTFDADNSFAGGTTFTVGNHIDTSSIANPAPEQVYQSERFGNFTYTVGHLTPGASYTLVLHFSENYWNAANKRMFNVDVNGVRRLTDFDIFASAGGEFKALSTTMAVQADGNGKLAVAFSGVLDQAKVDGIEVDPAASQVPAAAAAAIDSGGPAVGSYAADNAFTGGSTYSASVPIDTSNVSNPPLPQVYQSERFGNFTYAIPGLSVGSTYNVRLHFAELFWNAIGKRLFNVSINGTQVLTNYDIFKAAAGKFTAIAPSFTAVADGSGQITIVFTSLKDNAKVDGIEVTPA